MKYRMIILILSTFSFARDPFVYQLKPRIVAEGQINGEEITVVHTDGNDIKIKRKKPFN